MGLRSELTEEVAEVFTEVWAELEIAGETVTLLKASTTDREFDEIVSFSANWFFEYSNFRQNFLLEIAQDESIAPQIAEATHVQVGSEVYVIRSGDTTPPKSTDVTWKLFCDRFARREHHRSLY